MQCIRYLDVNSLYPYVMSRIEFPISHPEIRRGHTSCKNLVNKLARLVKKFIGLCQVKVLPPNNLFIPCLAYKLNNKLLFCLCRTCTLLNCVPIQLINVHGLMFTFLLISSVTCRLVMKSWSTMKFGIIMRVIK